MSNQDAPGSETVTAFEQQAARDIFQQKKQLRSEMNAARDALPRDIRQPAAEALAKRGPARLLADCGCKHLDGLIVAGFMPFRSEIDPMPLLTALVAAGARLALPRMTGDGLAFHSFCLNDQLDSGRYGIREPRKEARVVIPDIILAPLLAFDRNGGRLGYGKGYYDRAFAGHPEARRIGIAFAMQEVSEVPRAPHDILLHATLTET